MIDCMIVLCVYLTGGIGPQMDVPMDYYFNGVPPEQHVTHNDYGSFIGKVSFEVESGHSYLSFKHIGGLDTDEIDFGYNSIATGLTLRTHGGNLRVGIAAQSKSLKVGSSNNYGIIHPEFSYTRRLMNGFFFEMSRIDRMSYMLIGLTARLNL